MHFSGLLLWEEKHLTMTNAELFAFVIMPIIVVVLGWIAALIGRQSSP